MPTNLNPKIDAYIAKSQPFAQPILTHLRSLIHQACPNVQETIKWSRPFFEYKGHILLNISAFKAHCSVGFWGEEIGAVLRAAGEVRSEGMGTLGRIASLETLPPDTQLLAWLQQAVAFIDAGQYTSPIAARQRVVKDRDSAPKAAAKPSPAIPPEFAHALQSNPPAAHTFQNFAPSCRREYLEWIAEAKRPETREKRIQQSIQMLAEGKQRHWKYQTSGHSA